MKLMSDITLKMQDVCQLDTSLASIAKKERGFPIVSGERDVLENEENRRICFYAEHSFLNISPAH